MIPGRIAGATRYLGAPPDWNPDGGRPCACLPVKDVRDPDTGPEMHSVWELMPDELERLQRGAKVYLVVVGVAHPPVALTIGPVPSAEPDQP